MAQWLFELLRGYFQEWGYWTVVVALLLENAGVPVPGETILLFASFLAYSEQELRLPYIILFGTLACTVGDNIGYAIGYRGGRPLLERHKHIFRIPDRTIRRGEGLFARYGSVTIFFARFVFGMRIIAGPMAGVLRMPWKQFAVFNFLGAATWVTVISLVGFLFGSEWNQLMRILRRFNLGVLVLFVVVALVLWLRHRIASAEIDPPR
ncbi:MAG TPA: DedA family protein [Terriglobales bacterium]|nr:DedA family protein [Terriglobales bacterium]